MSDKLLDCVGVTGEVGKHDFVLTERSPESRQAYFSAKIADLIAAQTELAAVTRERNALKTALERCCERFVLANFEEGIRVEAVLREFSLRHEHALEALAKLESGELRKP